MARRARAQRLDEAAREAAREACELGSFAEAARLCEEALKELRGVFPPTSTMIAHEEAKLGMLRFNAWADAHAKGHEQETLRERERGFINMISDSFPGSQGFLHRIAKWKTAN